MKKHKFVQRVESLFGTESKFENEYEYGDLLPLVAHSFDGKLSLVAYFVFVASHPYWHIFPGGILSLVAGFA